MSSFVLSAAAEEDLIQIYTHGVVAFGPEQPSHLILRVRHQNEDWLDQ